MNAEFTLNILKDKSEVVGRKGEVSWNLFNPSGNMTRNIWL